jgi:hypothetical protein
LRTIRCARSVSMARARGEFGPPVSLGSDGQCTVIDDTGTVHIISRSAAPTTLPSLSEMVLANSLNYADRDVAIQWGGITSVLTGRGERAMWAQIVPTP